MPIADRNSRLQQQCRKMNLDFILVCSPGGITYYSGYFYFSEHGPSPFHFLPAILTVSPATGSTLLLAGNETAPPTGSSGIVTCAYESYSYLEPLHSFESLTAELKSILGSSPATRISIGTEKNYLPIGVAHAVETLFKSVEWIDITDFISQQRAIKEADEIELLKAAAGLCDAGQRSIISHAGTGQTELELFARVKNDVEEIAKTRIVMMADFVSGERTAAGGGIPSSKRINAGDLLLADLTPCLQGYWGDCCNTFSLSAPETNQKRDFQKIKDGLQSAIEKIKPGIKASYIDQLLRSNIFDYPHHSGHGVGTMSHEEPRITPYNDTRLEAGMVIALEPAIYREQYGIRLEHLVLVTRNGSEILTGFDHQFELA